MEFDYFYGPEDAEQYQFYRIPKLLITSDQFKDVSVEAKLLYGLMLDRLSLSIKNGDAGPSLPVHKERMV